MDLRQVPVAADTLRDLQAAHAAGCEPHLVRTGRAAGLDEAQVEQWQQKVPGVRVHADLAALAEHLIARQQRAAPLPTGGAS
jgi:D-glycero-D-manno-heptose 1,7-bisphosphate phosphatase